CARDQTGRVSSEAEGIASIQSGRECRSGLREQLAGSFGPDQLVVVVLDKSSLRGDSRRQHRSLQGNRVSECLVRRTVSIKGGDGDEAAAVGIDDVRANEVLRGYGGSARMR